VRVVGSIFTIMVTFYQDIYGVWVYEMAVIRGNTTAFLYGFDL
jgi:hypothetical protein